MDQLIGGNAEFESKLVHSQDDEALWLSYADAVAGDFPRSVFVLERAVTALPASALLWNAYLSLPWKEEDEERLISLLRRALSILPETPAHWFRLIDLLRKRYASSSAYSHASNASTNIPTVEARHLSHALNMALVNLHSSHHSKIWEIYLHLAETAPPLAVSIYHRLFEALNLSLAKMAFTPQLCVLRIAEMGDFTVADELFRRLPPKQDLDFLQSYMNSLSSNELFTDEAYFEQVAQNAMHDHPKSQHKVLFWLAEYHSDRQNPDKSRYLFSLAIKAAASVRDAAEAFDRYTNWEENQLERYVQANADSAAIEPTMAYFARVLGQHSLYINDVLLKQNPNCVDYWLDRSQLSKHPNDRIPIYVQAIRTINPLEVVSTRGQSLSTIWCAYADIYLNSGDVKSAELIYSRALKTPFRDQHDLTDLYIKWTELKLGDSDEAALKHVEDVLFLEIPGPDASGPNPPVNKKTETYNLSALARSIELWKFYLDLLQAVPDSGFDRLETAYKQLMSLQLISLRMLFDYADFLKQQGQMGRCYKAYESGLSTFRSPEAQAYIWVQYLQEYMQHESSDAIHHLFYRCLQTDIPGPCAYSIFSQYAQFCTQQGKIVQAAKVLQNGIDYLSKATAYKPEARKAISADKSRFYSDLLATLHGLRDDALLRQSFSSALEDSQLFPADSVAFGLQFVEFETSRSEFVRVRHLFLHLSKQGHPSLPLYKKIWDAWELFEAEHGDEKSFKEVLREKRTQIKRLGDVAELKAEINPIGFIKGETHSKPENQTSDVNPDAIELDMDEM